MSKSNNTAKPTATKPAPVAVVAVAKPAKLAPVAVAKPGRAASGPTYATLALASKGKSKIESPVAAMWDICNANIGKPRKDVVAIAIEAGVSYHTARTQYQCWLKLAVAAATAAAQSA